MADGSGQTAEWKLPTGGLPYSPFEYKRRETIEISNIGGKHVPVVIADLSKITKVERFHLQDIGYHYDAVTDKWNIGDAAADYILCDQPPDFDLPGTLKVILYYEAWFSASGKEKYIPLFIAKH